MEERLTQSILDIMGLTKSEVDLQLTRPDAKFGDASTNIIMRRYADFRRRLEETADYSREEWGRTPRDMADRLVALLNEKPIKGLEKAEVAGPGFINFWYTDEGLVEQTHRTAGQALDRVNYVLEYSCPNAFKELHTGHLYQTIFGDIVARLLEKVGAKVNRTSFGGDVGLHVAKCLYGMQRALVDGQPCSLDEVDPSPFVRANWISQCYVRGAKAYEDDEGAKNEIEQINKAVYALHEDNDHESDLAQLYWTTRQWCYDYFAAFYSLIEVDVMRYYPESQTAPVGMKVVREQLEKGNLKKSDGAVVFEGDEDKHLHTRVFVTSKGLPTYETKDIGVIWLEEQDYDFDHRILITGNDQKEYMRVVFAAADTFKPGIADKMTHLTNGTVRFGDGSKMSSRLGNVSRAIDVLEIVREKVRGIVTEPELIDTVALGAIKYAFARYRIGGDISFDLEETVSLAGNSGPYLQYAHARARSILAKSEHQGLPMVLEYEFNDSERVLVRKLGEYTEIMERAARELAPHHMCNYLFELAQDFNRFYEKNRVLGEAQEVQRLALVLKYADTLHDGLGLLGIAAPERM